MNIACVEAIPSNTAMHLTRPLQLTEAHRVPRTSSSLRAGDGQRWPELIHLLRTAGAHRSLSRLHEQSRYSPSILKSRYSDLKAYGSAPAFLAFSVSTLGVCGYCGESEFRLL